MRAGRRSPRRRRTRSATMSRCRHAWSVDAKHHRVCEPTRAVVSAPTNGCFGVWLRRPASPDKAQDGGAARRHAQLRQEPRSGSTAAGDADPPLRLGQPARAPGAGREEIGHRLGEGTPATARVGAVEAPDLDAQRRSRGGDRQIGRAAVAAMDGPAHLIARGTAADLRVRHDVDREIVRALLDGVADAALRDGERDGHAVHGGIEHTGRHRSESISRHPRKVSKSQENGAIPTRRCPA